MVPIQSLQKFTFHLEKILLILVINFFSLKFPFFNNYSFLNFRYLVPRGYTLAVTLEIADATLGGLAFGVGMTTYSHKVS